MNSIGVTCNELKEKYDSCFHSWFSDKFLKGDTNDTMCQPLFKIYQECVKACKDLRERYETCFNVWFSEKFLKGDYNESMCASLFKDYTDCVKNAMKEHHIDLKDVEENHLEQEEQKNKPGS